jgi:hypothetical protein
MIRPGDITGVTRKIKGGIWPYEAPPPPEGAWPEVTRVFIGKQVAMLVIATAEVTHPSKTYRPGLALGKRWCLVLCHGAVAGWVPAAWITRMQRMRP